MTHKYTPSADFSPGYIGVEASTKPTAQFGGSSWAVTSANPELGQPTLLLAIDLASPQMETSLRRSMNGAIPLFSFINTEGLLDLQEYSIDQAAMRVDFYKVQHRTTLLDPADAVATPIPEVALQLRAMRSEETSVDEQSYWQAIDTFLGGPSFLRVCGEPLFADRVIPAQDGHSYLASVGYSAPSADETTPGRLSFFVGELAFYFYVSHDWSRVRVLTQSV